MDEGRRQFIRSAGAAGALALGAPAVLGQNKSSKRYRTALIGSGWWGMNILREAMAAGSCEVVALCDVDRHALEVSADEVTDATGKPPKSYVDYRELLEKEDVEIAIIATPDHWHALQTIAAVEAGAHVFVEKPTGHTVVESRAMVEAAKNSGKVVQVGLHRRIGPHHVSGMKFLKDGGAGKIGMVRMFAHGGGGPEAPEPNAPVPDGMDWDLYCGPAPLRPFNRKIHPGGFRNFLDFANGTLGDWGVHWLDQILWWSDEKWPKRVFSTGGRPVRGTPVMDDTGQTSDAPDTQVAVYEFEEFTAVWEHRQYGGNPAERSRVGCYFHGTNGTFHMGWRDGWTFYPAKSGDKEIHEDPKFDHLNDGHNVKMLWADLVAAIETGRKPVADVETGHLSTNLSLLGMASLKLGRAIEWDGNNERILGDEAANALLRRDYRGPWIYPEA
ncbi:Gfo/Idh/MocA family oxidoreductase [soil metagenome]